MQCLRTSLVFGVLALAESCSPRPLELRGPSWNSWCQPLASGCAPLPIAQAWCGGTAVASPSGCVARTPCEKGRARELTTGECLPRRDVRALANEIGVGASDVDDVVCERGTLVASIEDTSAPRRLGCLAPAPAGGEKKGKADARAPTFEAGPLRNGKVLDVVRWAAMHLGTDGAPEAARPLCDAFARQPGALASPAGEVRAEIRLVFPDNDVAAVVLRGQILAPQAGISGTEATAELERVLAPLAEALRGIGGSASEATVSTRIRCPRASSRPVLEAP